MPCGLWKPLSLALLKMAQRLDREVKYIVQDCESGLFLMPHEGDVGFTSWAHEAGRFEAYSEAIDTAAINCHEGFFVTHVLI